MDCCERDFRNTKPYIMGSKELRLAICQHVVTGSLRGHITAYEDLNGKMNMKTRVIEKIISFLPYVKNETLYFKAQASVDEGESELIISG